MSYEAPFRFVPRSFGTHHRMSAWVARFRGTASGKNYSSWSWHLGPGECFLTLVQILVCHCHWASALMDMWSHHIDPKCSMALWALWLVWECLTEF